MEGEIGREVATQELPSQGVLRGGPWDGRKLTFRDGEPVPETICTPALPVVWLEGWVDGPVFVYRIAGMEYFRTVPPTALYDFEGVRDPDP